jgi:hypothetical protein
MRSGMLDKIITVVRSPLYLENKESGETYKVNSKTSIPLLKREFDIPTQQAKQIRKAIRLSKPISPAGEYKLVRNPSGDATFYLIIKVTMHILIPPDYYIKRFLTFEYVGDENGIYADVDDRVNEYLDTFDDASLHPNIQPNVEYSIQSQKTGAEYKFTGMKLREAQPLTIFNEYLQMYTPKEGINCVRGYLHEKTKISMKSLNKYGDEKGVSIDELNNICKRYRIKLKCFDTTGLLVSENINNHKRGSNYPTIAIMATNNHIYPIKNKQFHKKRAVDYTKSIITCGDIKTDLLEYLTDGFMPINIKTKSNNTDILLFETNEHVYLDNPDYKPIKEMCKKMGISEYVPYDITRFSIANFLMKYYVKENISSTWTNASEFDKCAINYYNKPLADLLDYDDITVIDKNKCFSYCILKLPFLIVLDYKIHEKITDFNKIVDHYLYIAKPKHWTVLMPCVGVYAGYHILYCQKYEIEFEILEGIQTSKVDNYLKQMVNDVYRHCEDSKLAKDIINFLYGKMYKSGGIKSEYYTVSKICNKDESKRTDGYKVSLSDEYDIIYDVKTPAPKLHTMKPISFQILDYSRIVLFEKMQELGLKDDDIVKIGTDSISFKNMERQNKKIENIGTSYFDWKYEEFKYSDKHITHEIGRVPSFGNKIYTQTQTTKLITGNAGNGKTYHIINKLIPTLKEKYIVLTPTHAAIKEYKKNKINSNVIQTYHYSNSIPSEDIVIIDEIGLVTPLDWNTIIKCVMANKDLYAYGDFTQLLPYGVSKQLNTDLLINCIFKYKETLKGNHRNNFTESYYDCLREEKNKDKLYRQIQKYSTKWEEAEYIICYRNETVEKYNEKKLAHLELKFGDVGCRIICRSNDLKFKKIFNKFIFEIIDVDEDIITLDNNTTITKKELFKYFKPGYAVTLCCIQGDSISSYYYPDEDQAFINGRSTYTLISRLKVPKIKAISKQKKPKKNSNLRIEINI